MSISAWPPRSLVQGCGPIDVLRVSSGVPMFKPASCVVMVGCQPIKAALQ
jgi:hypothetical protein